MASVLILIAAPGSQAINEAVTARLRRENWRWLAPREALEVQGFSGDAELVSELRALPIDVAILPAGRRRKKILIADMDSTMIEQECIDELGKLAGVGAHVADITARAMRGELDFEGALKERVALLKGLDAGLIDHILRERITYMAGGLALIATMKANGARAVLVSGGFRQFTSNVASRLGFDADYANELVIENGRIAGSVKEPILGADAKLRTLRKVAAEMAITPADAIAVGDGANDLPMLLEAGMGVALHAKPQVQAAARIALNHADLTGLLYLQGYEQREFVTRSA
jgi:phosphoserine phosphatase